jgi:hypothetical protein
MIVRFLAVLAALSIGIAPAAADTINSPTCRQDLAATWAKMEEMLAQLKNAARAGLDEKCETYRRHAEVVVKARDVFDRCKTGRDRVGDLAHMNGALDDVNTVIDRECGNGARSVQPHGCGYRMTRTASRLRRGTPVACPECGEEIAPDEGPST